MVDAKRKLRDPLSNGNDKDSEQAEGTGLSGGGPEMRRVAITSWKQKTLCGEGASTTVLGHSARMPIGEHHSWSIL